MALCAAAVAATACSVQPSAVAPLPAFSGISALERAPTASGKIAHVVIVVQENRSLDDLFQGFPGADTVASGKDSHGRTIALRPIRLETDFVIDHSFAAFQAAYDGGKMDGFNQEGHSRGVGPDPEYGYVPHDETQPYFAMAHRYVLGDRMFTSHLDESFVSHQYIIAAQASHSVNLPYGIWGCDGGPSDVVQILNADRTLGSFQQACFDHKTLADEIDAAGLTWHFYAGRIKGRGNAGGYWSAYQAIKHIRFGPDWAKDVISPQKRFLTDVASGVLSNVTWITPTCLNSDHTACGGDTGPSWVASIVNAVGRSRFWDSTAIFVMWDEWGGWYDHVPPPYVDYDGLGMRVPLLVISPYAKRGYVSHVQYEHGSILKFAEDQFGLGRLAASDTRANSPAQDCFDFSQPPRKFEPILAPYGERYFLHQPLDARIPDTE